MVGRTVGQYRIIEQLGSGGMGIVYKAHDTRLDRTVALKFLPPHLSSDENSKARFIQEARAASALDHANICTIHDIDEDENGKLFIVMSFYEGQTLKYLLDDGALSVEHAVQIGYQIAAGLARAHEAGIVHRDVKPANIMVTDRGEVKILDFGVAKLTEGIDLTKTGSTVGTAAYMSPEQAKGEPVDFRADIWSVGVLLYEMLTGRKPFDGTYEAALIYGIVNGAHDPITVELPDGLEAIIDGCLAKAVDERPASAVNLAQELGAYTQSSGSGIQEVALSGTGVRPVRATASTSTTVAGASPPASTAASSASPSTAPVPPHEDERPARGRSPLTVTSVYAIVAGAVSGLVYASMIKFGLPSWVFPAGIILLTIGLPSIFIAARNEQQHAVSGFTLRRAVWGGIVAMAGLTLVSVAYMAMGLAGIGPGASLQSSGALVENAQLVIADFQNNTNDERLAESVTEALRIDLSQSNVIQLMDESDLVSVLNRMNRPVNSRIDTDTAMEIAAREGAEAVVAGEISSLGAGFILSARLIAAHNGEELVALRENAEDDSAIIGAVDKLSARLREKIGESIKNIRSNEDLDHVTTSSLDALRLFSQAISLDLAGESARAIELLREAVEIDSTFAMAYRKLGVIYGNMGRAALSNEASTRAFELRDNLPERERGLAAAFYYSYVDTHTDRAIDEYENVLLKYPDDGAALNNVAIIYNMSGQHKLAAERTRHALEIGIYPVYFNNNLSALAALGRTEETDSVIARIYSVLPDHPFTPVLAGMSYLDRGDYDRADSVLDAMETVSLPGWEQYRWDVRSYNDAMHGRLTKAGEGLTRAENIAVEQDDTLKVLERILVRSIYELDIREDVTAVRKLLSDGLTRYPLSSLAVLDRPYDTIIGLYSRLGETESAGTILEEYKRLVPSGRRLVNLLFQTTFYGEAELLAAQGDVDAASALYAGMVTETECIYCMVFRRAQMMEWAGRKEEAIMFYKTASEAYLGSDFINYAPLKSLAYLHLGELYSEAGQTDMAIEAYTRFEALWKDADDDLQDRVQYARNRIDQLLKQEAREPR